VDGDDTPAAGRGGTARDEVQRLLAERGEQLMRAAIALAGSRADGEDLLQAALERLLRRWHHVEAVDLRDHRGGHPRGLLVLPRAVPR
jgi:DNA-directed RNA polymerase specialized sigma24 family protein